MLKKMRNKLKDNKGFTLIELIVVIAIIAVLLSLAVPRIMGYTEMARETSDEQLAALYRNTFNILLASGKAVATADTDILVKRDGTISYRVPATKLYGEDGTTELDLGKVQADYISKNNGVLPKFQSKKYNKGTTGAGSTDGIIITVTYSDNSVAVGPNNGS